MTEVTTLREPNGLGDFRHHRHPADDPFSTLIPQEDRILALIGDGLTNREIADQLSLSEKTINNYVSHSYAKLHVERRSQATGLATERRIRREQS